MASTEPRRGEVWLVSFGAARSGEPGKNRPAIVISSDSLGTGTAADPAVVVPLSSSSPPSVLRPGIQDIDGVDRPSRAICRSIRGVANSRLLRRLEVLEPAALNEVERALTLMLELDAMSALRRNSYAATVARQCSAVRNDACLVGMAYVVARPKGRFEIRESLHTPDGPRAHSLAGFAVLSDAVLAKAAQRAQRSFDAGAVLASARRAGAPTGVDAGAEADARERFVNASRRMARALQPRPTLRPIDPGAALIDLLGFADAVTRSRPPRPPVPLEFPVLSRLVERRRDPSGPA